jgi:uncharacterized protein (DUF169 family)
MHAKDSNTAKKSVLCQEGEDLALFFTELTLSSGHHGSRSF